MVQDWMDKSDKAYNGRVVFVNDSGNVVAYEHNFDTTEEVENWVLGTMMQAVKDNPNIEEVDGDWESVGMMGKTFKMFVGF